MLFAVGSRTPSELDVRVDRYNQRIRFVGPERPSDFDHWLAWSGDALDGIGKIILYARDDDRGWQRRGFVPEGTIDRYFADGRHAVVMSKFTDGARSVNVREREEDRIVALSRENSSRALVVSFPAGFSCRVADVEDSEAISTLLQSTFEDYPDPIDRDTVARWIRDGERRFRVVEHDGDLVACASADLDRANRSAELTDCATRPEMRGRGLMTAILRRLEIDCSEELGIADFYTLARAGEAGINIAFARLGYRYTGRLVNNCRMPDGWESMNAWCRSA